MASMVLLLVVLEFSGLAIHFENTMNNNDNNNNNTMLYSYTIYIYKCDG